MMKWLMLLFLLTPPLGSQVDYLRVKCTGQTGAPLLSNYLIMTGQAEYPLCLAIGPTLKITIVNGHAQLDAVPLAAPGTAISTGVGLTTVTILGKQTIEADLAYMVHLDRYADKPDPILGSGCNVTSGIVIGQNANYFCVANLPLSSIPDPWGHWVKTTTSQ